MGEFFRRRSNVDVFDSAPERRRDRDIGWRGMGHNSDALSTMPPSASVGPDAAESAADPLWSSENDPWLPRRSMSKPLLALPVVGNHRHECDAAASLVPCDTRVPSDELSRAVEEISPPLLSL